MGDIKDLRNAIIHNRGILDKEMKILELHKGHNIEINQNLFDKVIDLIKTEMESIKFKIGN